MPRNRIERWEPEDPQFWGLIGRRVADRNLWFSVFSEHIGFSVWSLWSVLVLFMGPAYHVDAAGKFLLVSMPTLVGALLRVPYSLAVAKFGGRTWTAIGAVLLLVPCALAGFAMHPGVSYPTLLVVAAFAGVGGGNFASSMTNINAFYPERHKGRALGINAGGGNLGVAAVQLVGLLIIGTAGADRPRILLWIYIPLIVLSAACAALFMDNLGTMQNDTNALRAAGREPQTWILSFLYIGTFGSFIGYSFAFGLVLQNQFDRTPLQAAALTFVGPLVGSVTRPLGGWLADQIGGSRITAGCFGAMAIGTAGVIAASDARSLGAFLPGFIALFVFSGIGSGSVYKMIPAVFAARADARRISGAVIGIAGAVGALGGLLVNLAFRESFLNAKSGVPAFIGFLVFYGLCFAVTFAVYLRSAAPARSELAYAGQR
jgi:NNP family nitrate/nitrite transporter-like MFS transporter